MKRLVFVMLIVTVGITADGPLRNMDTFNGKDWSSWQPLRKSAFLEGYFLGIWTWGKLLEMGIPPEEVYQRLTDLLNLNTGQAYGIMDKMTNDPRYKELPLWVLLHQLRKGELHDTNKHDLRTNPSRREL